MYRIPGFTWVPETLGTWVYLAPPESDRLLQAVNLDQELPNQPSTDVPESVSKRLSFRDKVIVIISIIIAVLIIAHVHPLTPAYKQVLYIYTSGTTGLPKAAVVKNSR